MDDQIPEDAFASAAWEYCDLVEQCDSYERDPWLSQLGSILLKLEAAAESAAVPARPTSITALDLEKRFELYFRLKNFLDEADDYWSEADLAAADGYMTGSLSDDFADIYFELKQGFVALDRDAGKLDNALAIWTRSYFNHWRQHLIDARRQLFEFGRMRPSRC